MSDPNFDPYHKWLGIPPEHQPPNHYRLLGLELFESDPDVIDSASLEQIAYIRTFALGPQSEQSQSLLNEMSAARVTLLDAVQKADYDQELRQQLNVSPPRIEAISENTQQTVTAPTPSLTHPPVVAKSEEIQRATSAPQSKQKLYIRVVAGLLLTLVILVCSIFYLRAQRINEAVSLALNQGDYHAALELDPSNPQALALRLARDLRQALAKGDYARALLLDPGNPEALELRSSDLKQALADGDYSRALEIDPTNAEALAMKKSADLRQALVDRDHARALEIDPGNTEALAMKKEANIKEALAKGDYARALLLDPGNPEALELRSSDLKQALADGDYSRALEIDPTNAGALEMKQSADLRQALADGDHARALEIDPNHPEALEMKKAADIKEALAVGDYESALEIDPNQPKALAMKKAADIREALAVGDYESALEIDPNQPKALEMKKAADIKEALAVGDYESALEIDPNHPEALELKKAADIKEALAVGDYESALLLDPNHPEAIEMKRADAAPPRAIAPFNAEKAKEHQEAWAKYLGVEVETENSIGMKLRVIPAGSFVMGSDTEKPRHQVTLSKPFLMGTCEVTEAQWMNVMGSPGRCRGRDTPIANVDWTRAVEFCLKLSALPAERAASRLYSLPMEAQWEYACRAGTTTEFSYGNDNSDLDTYRRFVSIMDKSIYPVGISPSNAFGLHDMHGNAWEWCQNRYEAYPSDTTTDQTDSARSGANRVLRGGGWASSAQRKKGLWGSFQPNGLRVVCITRPKHADVDFAGSSDNAKETDSAKPPPAQFDNTVNQPYIRSDKWMKLVVASAFRPSAGTAPRLEGFNAPPLAMAPFKTAKAKDHQETWAKYLGLEVETENSIGMKLRVIPPGTFTMGEEDTAHAVTLTKPFMLGKYEVTQAEYARVMHNNPSGFKPENNPVENVSWNDAMEFCRRMSEIPAEKTAGRVYKLPTEAQWEYSCRAGTTTAYSFGFNVRSLDVYAWYNLNSGKTTHAVGRKKANPWGLCDMHGNVWEWCSDWYGNYPNSPALDPRGPDEGRSRVHRGNGGLNVEPGSPGWNNADYCTSASRGRHSPSFRTGAFGGFRVVCIVNEKDPDTNLDAKNSQSDNSNTPTAAREPAPAIAPFDAVIAKEHQQAWAKHLAVEVETENSIGMKLRVIPPGTFTMGEGDTAHAVTLTKPFMLGTHEVTQAQYEEVMGCNPSTAKTRGAKYPVDRVSWNNAMAFCCTLSHRPMEMAAGRVYLLPTEQQWEYACRAGTVTKFSFGIESKLGKYGWFEDNSDRNHPVGEKESNAWGLHDMHGNVREWCQDWYSGRGPADTDPASLSSHRFYRGGSWFRQAQSCRSASRFHTTPDATQGDIGFRVVCILTAPETFPMHASGETP